MQKWRANVALHLDKTAQKRISRERAREKERKERRKLCHGERTQRDTTQVVQQEHWHGSQCKKSGWRRHVACDDERREERWSVVVTSSQREGARERQQQPQRSVGSQSHYLYPCQSRALRLLVLALTMVHIIYIPHVCMYVMHCTSM